MVGLLPVCCYRQQSLCIPEQGNLRQTLARLHDHFRDGGHRTVGQLAILGWSELPSRIVSSRIEDRTRKGVFLLECDYWGDTNSLIARYSGLFVWPASIEECHNGNLIRLCVMSD